MSLHQFFYTLEWIRLRFMSIFLFILWKGIHLYDSYTIYCDKKLKSFKYFHITWGTFNYRQAPNKLEMDSYNHGL